MDDRSSQSFGQAETTWVDRLGVWMSMRAIRKHLPERDNLHILDLGCGYRAAQLLCLRDKLESGTCVDFNLSDEVKAESGITAIEGAVEEVLPGMNGGSFDVVLLISVLEHLRSPTNSLEEIRGLLKPDGILLLNVPTWRGKWFLEFSAFRLGLSPKIEMDDHKMYYDKRDLWPLLVASGFKPSKLSLSYHKFGLNLFAVASR